MSTSAKISREEALLRRALVDFRHESVFAPLVYRDKSKIQFVKGKGSRLRMLRPARGGSAEGPIFQAQPIVDRETEIRVNFHRHTGFEVPLSTARFDLLDFYGRHVKAGFNDVCARYDVAIASTVCGVPWAVGTPGQVPGDFMYFANARGLMNAAGVPQSMRNAVIDSNTYGVLADQIKDLPRSSQREELTKGYSGDLMGFRIAESENIPPHTVGDYTGSTLQVDGANQKGNRLTLKGAAHSKTIFNKGDVIWLQGVSGVHPITKQPMLQLKQFVVQAPVTSDGAGAAEVLIYPELNDGTMTTVNEEGQVVSLKNYQTVTDLPADNAVVKVYGESGKTYSQSYFFHKHAIVGQDVGLEKPEGCPAGNYSTVRDGRTGATASYIKGFDGKILESFQRIDLLGAIKLIEPEFAVKIYGAMPQAIV